MEHRKLSEGHSLGRCALSLLATSAVFAAGCANMTTTAPGISALAQSGKVTGKVHGGSQPVAGATVSLYYAGQSGLRSAASLQATTTTSSTGSFQFTKDPTNGNGSSDPNTGSTFSCPTNIGDPQVYVIARGGNTQDSTSGYNNTASAFLAGLGSCSSITTSTVVTMSEVTTVATLAAVGQYMDPVSESIGADGTLISYNGLANAFGVAGTQLVDLSNGTARGATSRTGISVSVTSTPETAKINLIADVISACVNNASASASNCTTLFANATPPSLLVTGHSPTADDAGDNALPAATDVIQAALYMLTNPTDGSPTHLANLFNLPPGVSAPYLPTLSSAPTDWTVGISIASSGACTGGGNFIQNANQLSIDVNGDVWISNGGGNLSELSPSGIPLTCQSLPPAGSAGSVIDLYGNIWVASYSSNNVFRYRPSDSSILTYTTAYAPIGLTADGSGNIYFSTFAGGGSSAGLYVITNGANDASGSQHTPTLATTDIGAQAFQLMPDTTGAIWSSSYGGTIAKTILTSGTYASTSFNVGSPSYGIAVTAGNNVYTSAANGTNTLTYLTGSGSSYTIANGFPTPTGAAGLNSPLGISVDGAQNVWAANNTFSSDGNGAATTGSISEITNAGASLSPDATGFQKNASYLRANRSLVIDQSGNVWVGEDNSAVVTEIIGAAVPVFQPYSLGLSNGRFQAIP